VVSSTTEVFARSTAITVAPEMPDSPASRTPSPFVSAKIVPDRVAGRGEVTVRLTASDTDEVFPAGSVAVAVSECVPSCSVEVVIDHVPPDTVSVPTSLSRSDVSVTVIPSSLVPVIVGVLSLVGLDGALITGAAGAVLSMLMLTVLDTRLAVPRASVRTPDDMLTDSCVLSVGDATSNV